MKKNKYTPSNKAQRFEPMTRKPLEKINFILMAISAGVIILGFLLMLGKGTSTTEFNPDIFSTRRIVVGPTIAFLGFIFMAIAIIYRGKEQPDTKATE